jgi:hypothetical protein
MDIVNALAAIPAAGPVLPYLAAAIAACAAAAVVLPHPAASSTGIYPKIYAAVNYVAMNFGQAKNAPAKPPEVPNIES